MSLNFVSRTISNLKKRYGVSLEYYRPITNNFDPMTGVVTRAYQSIAIKKAIVLPTKIMRSFKYDLAFVAANKNFTDGGFYDKGELTACIEYKDMQLIRPELDDFVVYLGRKWEVKSVNEWAEAQAYELTINEIKNSSGEKFVRGSSTIIVSEEGTHE